MPETCKIGSVLQIVAFALPARPVNFSMQVLPYSEDFKAPGQRSYMDYLSIGQISQYRLREGLGVEQATSYSSFELMVA